MATHVTVGGGGQEIEGMWDPETGYTFFSGQNSEDIEWQNWAYSQYQNLLAGGAKLTNVIERGLNGEAIFTTIEVVSDTNIDLLSYYVGEDNSAPGKYVDFRQKNYCKDPFSGGKIVWDSRLDEFWTMGGDKMVIGAVEFGAGLGLLAAGSKGMGVSIVSALTGAGWPVSVSVAVVSTAIICIGQNLTMYGANTFSEGWNIYNRNPGEGIFESDLPV
ncbi:MAG: hypothetical protein GYA51_12045 [Candidatus Methanofastidiosa archaeon]|jgi:hypothetical protein|nr:hypothetical protein [Candidatus Methanofastidiosa archaeon]